MEHLQKQCFLRHGEARKHGIIILTAVCFIVWVPVVLRIGNWLLSQGALKEVDY